MKRKTVTVNQLYKMLGKIIEKGQGRCPVCISKTTFTHNCESDGCTILPVDGVQVEQVLQMNEDGGSSDANGMEHYRRNAVLYGESGAGYLSLLDSSHVDEYIKTLEFAEGTPDIHVTLVAGNIRGFASHVRSMCGLNPLTTAANH